MGMASARVLTLCRVVVLALVLISLCSCKRHPKKKKAKPVASGSISSVTMQTPTDPAQAPLYGKVELLVKFDAAKFAATAFYDPDPAQGGVNLTATFTGPSGAFTVPGFYDGTNFLIRFSPTAVGAWTFSIAATDPGGPGAYTGGSFTCVASTNPGFVLIDGRYLRRSHDNSIFFPVGHHMGWRDNVEQPTLTDMASRGENLLAYWQAMPWATTGDRAPIEGLATGGVGNYYQTACAWLDGLVGRAEAEGVCLQPTIWSHGELRLDVSGLPWGAGYWSKNGYSAICATPDDFFVFDNAGADTPQWRYQKNFLRYLFARYGYSRAIANWVVLAEVNGTEGGAADPPQAIAWLQQVRGYWAALDVYRSRGGVQAPVAAFWTDSTTYDPGLDLRSIDTYAAQDNDVQIGAYAGGYTQALSALTPPKPCFLGEFGGRLPPSGSATQPRHAHNGLWSSVSAGACMTPLLWCDGASWPLLTQASGIPIRNHLQCLGTFMAGVDCLSSPVVTSEPVLFDFLNQRWGWSTHSNDRGFAWVYSWTTFTGLPITATVTGLDDGTYSVQWYDVWTSATPTPLSSATATSSAGTLVLACPSSALSDLACKFVRTGALPAPVPSLSTREARGAVLVVEQIPPAEPVPPPAPVDPPPPDAPPPQEPPPEDPLCPEPPVPGEPVAPPIAPGDF
jgi:hypothetical protein